MKNAFVALACLFALLACSKPEEKTPETVAEATPPPQSEIGDAKYVEMGKSGIAKLSSGDIDGWMASYADNAKYYWSSGDSLIGKQAIADYWKNRRADVIDSISFTNDIWIPLKVNVPQRGPDQAGTWLLSWYHTSVKYKNGAKLSFWVHTGLHYDSQDKIDVVVQYLDRAPINAALAKK